MIQKTKRFINVLRLVFILVGCLAFTIPSKAQHSMSQYSGTMKVYLDKSLSGTYCRQHLRVKEVKLETKYTIYSDPFSVSSFDIPALKCIATGKKVANDIELSGKINNNTGAFPITGSLKGTIDKKGVAKVVYTLKFGKMPMTIYAHYEGKK